MLYYLGFGYFLIGAGVSWWWYKTGVYEETCQLAKKEGLDLSPEILLLSLVIMGVLFWLPELVIEAVEDNNNED